MNIEKQRKSVINAVKKTFGDMAFMDVIEKFDDTCVHNHISCILGIEFNEPENGALYLFLPKELKKTIVENIYGANWNKLTMEQVDDCLLELLNVLAGNYMTAFYGKSQLYTLSFPTVIFDKEEILHIDKMKVISLNAEHFMFEVGLIIQGRVH